MRIKTITISFFDNELKSDYLVKMTGNIKKK